MWPVFTGRKDGTVSLASDVGGNLPSANANFTTLLTQFGTKSLNLNDLVTLSGIQSSLHVHPKYIYGYYIHAIIHGFLSDEFFK